MEIHCVNHEIYERECKACKLAYFNHLDQVKIVKEREKQDAIFRGQCLNVAATLLSSFQVKDFDLASKNLFRLAKVVFEQGKNEKFQEWK